MVMIMMATGIFGADQTGFEQISLAFHSVATAATAPSPVRHIEVTWDMSGLWCGSFGGH
jgi:hypothetical protein